MTDSVNGWGSQQIPYSQEAEEAVIGAVLVNPVAYFGVASFLQPDDFFILRHKYIWQALTRLTDRSEPIDYLTLTQELKDMDKLAEIGGPAYLTQLINSTPTSVHAEIYGRLVERAATRRRLMAASDEIKSLALNDELTIEQVINESESKLFDVTERQLTRELIPMREAISSYFDRVEHLMYDKDAALGLPSGFKDLDKLLGGLQKSDLIIFAGRPGMGKCVAAGTLVPTERGLLPIEALKPEGIQGVADDEGGIYYPLKIGIQTPCAVRKTAYFYDSGFKPTLKITTRAGHSLAGTHVHPVMVLTKAGEKAWKQLGELEHGDFIAIQRHQAVWGNEIDLPEFKYDFYKSGYTSRPNLPSQMSVELAYMMGLLAGDGGLTRKNYVTISSADPEILDTFYEWNARLGLSASHNKAYDHRVGSAVLNAWLKHIGLSGYAYEKEVPYTIMQAPKECVRAFLQGLFDTDGHAELQNGYIQFVSTSEKLTRQVHTLLLQFGVVSKLTFKANKYRGAWLIRITGDAARIFYENIGFRLERKQTRRNLLPETSNSNLDVIPYLPPTKVHFGKRSHYPKYFRGVKSPSYAVLKQIAEYAPEVETLLEPEFYWDEITTIEDAGLQHCYDLTVPDGHAFVANGIVNHNTSFMLSAAINLARLGARIAIFSMEMGVEQIVQRFVSMEAAINSQNLRLGQLSQQEYSRFVHAAGNLSNFRIFIDDTPAMSPLQMRTKCLRMAREHGIDLVIVDYMQLMNAGGAYENNRVQEISYISRNMKEMARELNVPVMSAAQLSRAVEQRQDKRPVLSDLRESGCLAGDSLVYLPDEGRYAPIRELVGKSGFRVTSLNTETWKLEPGIVTNAFCTGTKPVYRLTTQLGRTIRATANHKFLTIQGWKRLDELTENDHIALPRRLDGPSKQTMSDAELALLGHLIGDGCTLPRHVIQYTTRECDLAEIVARLALDVFDDEIQPRIHQEIVKGVPRWYQVFLPTTRKITHGVRNPISEWLTELGVFGLRSYEKRVPDKVFAQPAEAIALFLRHLWATDGCVKLTQGKSHYPAVYYASSSERLSRDVQALLLRLGINARLSKVLQTGKGRDQYHVEVSGNHETQLFLAKIGAVGAYKQQSTVDILRYFEGCSSNTNRDIIPNHIWRMHAVPAMQSIGLTTRQMQAELGHAYCGTGLYKQNVSREQATRLAEVVQSDVILNIAHSDVYWDSLASIEPDGEIDVYDLTVPAFSNFIANGTIVHNSIEQDADVVMFLYRDEVYNEATEFPNQADIIVAKHRNGPTGTISLYFEKTLTKFMNAAERSVDLSHI